MIIDFHTHVFPEKIASQTITALAEAGGTTPYSNGTFDGLMEKLKDSGVSIAVNLPVLTKPTQFDSIFRFASEINSHAIGQTKIISFMGMHPDIEDIEGDIKKIHEANFLGIKLHPDYQNTFFDDEKYVKIISEAKKYSLTVVTTPAPILHTQESRSDARQDVGIRIHSTNAYDNMQSYRTLADSRKLLQLIFLFCYNILLFIVIL